MEEFMTPVLSAEQLADDFRYGEDEIKNIEDLVLGAQALLNNAGAFKPHDPMTKVAVKLIVGHWLENRDSMNYDYKEANKLPYSLKAIIHSLQYLPDKVVDSNE